MSQRALCVGINQFENLPMNSWLNGCVNDAHDTAALLTTRFGFPDKTVTVLTDAAATKSAVLGELTDLLDRAKTPGEDLTHIVFTLSSHGTQLPDTNGDEPDQVDEAFVTYDLRQQGDQWDPTSLIVDDELHDLFAHLPQGVLLDVILDTCHSGSGLRAIDLLPGRRPRFVPPPTALGLTQAENADSRSLRDLVRSSSAHGTPELFGKPVLFAACRSDQTAADANFEGRYNGAFTHFLLESLTGPGGPSRSDVAKQVNLSLRNHKFAQRAQLEASTLGKSTAWGSAF